MKHQALKTFGTLVLALGAMACGRPHDTVVQPLPAATQAAVDQNLKNGRVPTPADVASQVPAAADACQTFRSKLPADWMQGTLSVPEDPAQPKGTQIQIFYYGKIASGSTPVIFFNGGPGSDSHGSATLLSRYQKFYDPKGSTSFIYIDQRGTGCSSFYPQGSTPDVLQRLSHYGSRGIVADAEAVRAAIWQNKPWLVFGQSYGGFIVHRYATIAPEAVKAAFSHANVITPDGYIRLRERIAAQVRVSEIYLKQYPEDRRLLQTLKDQLPYTKCFTSGANSKQRACGWAPLSSIAGHLLGFTDQWLSIHEWLGLMATPGKISDDGISRFLAAFYFSESNPLNSQLWSARVIGWVDRSEPNTDATNCLRVRDDLAKTGVDLKTAFANECATTLQWADVAHPAPADTMKDVEFLTKDPLTIPDFLSALRASRELNFYLYSGQKDAYVPVANFASEVAAAKGIANLHYTNFNGTGHDGFFTEAQVWRDILSESSL